MEEYSRIINETKKETIVAHDSEKAYLEHYAKELLESLFPTRYAGLQHSECPDLLMGDDYGIEVTWAMYRKWI